MSQPDTLQSWVDAPLMEKGSVELICQQVIKETPDISTFVFQTVEKARFRFKPGQFLTLMHEVAGEKIYRSYTISSSPSRPYSLSLTIQRVEGGKMSPWLFEHLKPGAKIQATGPDGVFNIIDIPARKVLFLSASCGITPVMSMTRWLLDTCTESDIRFIHSAKSAAHIVYHSELEMLGEQYDHFRPEYVLDDCDGLLNIELLHELAPDFKERSIYICGSPAYINAVREMVEVAGFDMANFHQEVFNDAMIEEIAARDPVGSDDLDYEITLSRTGTVGTAKPGTLLVDHLLEQKAPLVAACRAGVCGACKIQIEEGEVNSTSQMTLTPQEIEQGYVLACCSTPESDLRVNI